MKAKIIVNPYANRWGAKAQVAAIQAAFTAVSLPFALTITEQVGQGVDEAKTAVAAGYDCIVAAGGDGTIHEVINGLVAAVATEEKTPPFGILPLGTANDLSDMIGLPHDLETAVQIIAAGHTRQIDAGIVNGKAFANNSAIAMEPMVTLENIKMARLSGTLRYMIALAKALIKLRAWQMQIRWDDGGYDGPAYLLSVCNGPRTGGFYMAPQAQFDDGLFDFVFAPEIPKTAVLAVLIRLLMGGKHIAHPQVTYGRTRQLSIQSSPGTPIHADGELLSTAATAIQYHILPAKITLLTPPAGQ